MDVDDVLSYVGNFGRFQISLVALFSFMEFPNGLLIMSPYFVEENPAWKCVKNSSVCRKNGTFSVGQQGYEIRCEMPRDAWSYVKKNDFSIVTQFDIYCDKEVYITLVQSLPFISWAIGGIVSGWLIDRFGRKLIVLGSSFLVIILGFTSAFSPSFIFYIIMRILIGFFVPFAFAQKIVLVSEFLNTDYRHYGTLPIGIAFGLSASVLSLIAYYSQSWRMLLILGTAPFAVTVFFYWYVPESIRWLRVQGRMDDVHAIVTRIAKINKKEIEKFEVTELQEENFFSIKYILDLFRPKKVAFQSLIHGFAWIVAGLGYYGVAFAAADLGGRKYRDFVLASISDLAGTFACFYFLRRFGRKKPIILSYLIAGLACVAVALIPSRSDDGKRTSLTDFRVFLGMVGKFFISVCFSGIYLWSTESYPTVMRGIGMGYLQIAARIGSALAPWVVKGLKSFDPILPFALMGSSAVMCSGLLLMAPDTANKAMADTRKDQIALSKVQLVETAQI